MDDDITGESEVVFIYDDFTFEFFLYFLSLKFIMI